MRYCLISFLIAVLMPLGTYAQDVHFSQFFSSPLTVNPAQTAYFEEDWRVGLNYKNQWPWGSSSRNFTYRTISAYGDGSVFDRRAPVGDRMGVGANVVHDRAGDGQLSVTKARVTGAYHLSLDRFNDFYLSFGAGLAFVQKQINYDNLYFNEQWTDNGFDQDIPSGENPDGNSLTFMDVTAGAMLSGEITNDISISTGLALYHLNLPQESFYGNDNRLGPRPIANAGATFNVTDRITISPGIMYSNQKRAQETVFGSLASFKLPFRSRADQKLFAGAYYRWDDAAIPLVGYQYGSLRVLVNYDINVSSLTLASGGQGGLEVSVVYTGIIPGKDRLRVIPCPRM